MEHSSTLVTRLLNPFVKLLLRSPLHGIMSDNVILVTFTGRKSGKRYVTPVSYVREGNTITFLTHGSWWKTLRVKGGTGVRVLLRVRGRDMEHGGRGSRYRRPEGRGGGHKGRAQRGAARRSLLRGASQSGRRTRSRGYAPRRTRGGRSESTLSI